MLTALSTESYATEVEIKTKTVPSANLLTLDSSQAWLGRRKRQSNRKRERMKEKGDHIKEFK
jgi:hypothetical protein